MTINEYQKEVAKAMGAPKQNTYDYNELMNGILGLQSRCGACSEEMRRHLFGNKPFDKTTMACKLGEVASYLALCTDAIGMNLEDIFAINLRLPKERQTNGSGIRPVGDSAKGLKR